MTQRKPPDVWIVWYQALTYPAVWFPTEARSSRAAAEVMVHALAEQHRGKGGVKTIIKAYRELKGIR